MLKSGLNSGESTHPVSMQYLRKGIVMPVSAMGVATITFLEAGAYLVMVWMRVPLEGSVSYMGVCRCCMSENRFR